MADPTPPDRSRIKAVPLHLPFDRERRELRLPASLTSFVSREGEVAAIAGLLRRSDVRLVTLTGPGGVGKTRLALRVAEDTATDLGHGVAFVPLAPVRDPAFVAATVASAIGLPEVAGRDPSEAVPDFLGNRRFLLVLDNLEHLLPAAAIATSWLAACPRLTVLATSRAVLRVTGEHRFDVAPLDVPDLDRLSPIDRLAENPAVRLFIERARASRVDFKLTPDNAGTVAAICVRLDGLPLAIELAAARIQHLPPLALLGRLERRLPVLTDGPRDQPVRLQSLRDAIAWSYDLLPGEEQVLLQCLSVFVGGFTLEAAEAVSGDSVAERRTDGRETSSMSVLDGIASLVGKSLVWPEETPEGQPRYQMLETVREFGLERLAASGDEDTLRGRHLDWCLGVAEEHHRAAGRGLTANWLDRLEREVGNLRVALSFADRADDGEMGLRLATALFKLWQFRGHRGEGRRWLERALARDTGVPSVARASALWVLGYLENSLGDRSRAVDRLEESLVLARELGNIECVQFATWGLAAVATNVGRHDERTAALLTESGRAAEERGDVTGVAGVRLLQADLARHRRDLALAEALLGEGLAFYRDQRHLAGVSWCLRALGAIAADRGDYVRAAALYAETLENWRGAGVQEELVDWLAMVGLLAAGVGRSAQATRLLAAADALREQCGAVLTPRGQQRYEQAAGDLRTILSEAEFAAAWNAGRALVLDEAIAAASAVLDEQVAPTPRGDGGDAAARAGLTPRERQVLVLIAQGLSDREVAAALFVGPRTVRSHLTGIFGKLGVGSRTAAIATARRLGIL